MIGDDALDAALRHISTTASRIDVCATRPTSYAEATASIGYTTQFTVSDPTRCERGRKAVVSGIESGSVTRKGRPAYWVLTGLSRVLACGAIDNAPELSPGTEFRLPPIDIEIKNGD